MKEVIPRANKPRVYLIPLIKVYNTRSNNNNNIKVLGNLINKRVIYEVLEN